MSDRRAAQQRAQLIKIACFFEANRPQPSADRMQVVALFCYHAACCGLSTTRENRRRLVAGLELRHVTAAQCARFTSAETALWRIVDHFEICQVGCTPGTEISSEWEPLCLVMYEQALEALGLEFADRLALLRQLASATYPISAQRGH